MSETKFTPGPWVVSGKIHNYGSIVCPASQTDRPLGASADTERCKRDYMHQIAAVNKHSCHFSSDESKANAYLIAAAPELYEALKGLVAVDDGIGEGDSFETAAQTVNDLDAAMQRARAAIAKAEGRS